MNIAVAVLLFASLISCKDTGTGPNQKPFKDPRQMTWTADTLSPYGNASQLLPESMLAFTPNDVWLACWSDVAKKVMWHFDGKTWNESDIEGQSGPIGLDALAGNSSSDLWAGGFYGIPNSYVALSHYNGSTWTRVDLKIPGEILDMTTDPSGNIWACGRNGVILKYSQGKWVTDTIKITGPNYTKCSLYSVQNYNGKVFVMASVGSLMYAYLMGDLKNWTVMDTMSLNKYNSVTKWGNYGLYSSSYGKLYSYGAGGVWKFGGSVWTQIFNFNQITRKMYGASENYIIQVSDFKSINFYNGNGWQSISDLFNVNDPSFGFITVWTDGHEVLLAGYGTFNGIEKTVIWHGK